MSSAKPDTAVLESQIQEIQRLEEELIERKRHLLIFGAITSKPTEADSDREMFFLILNNKRKSFAIPVNQVEEVIEMVALVSKCEDRFGVMGLIDYHGDLIAVFDLGELAGMGRTPVDSDNVVIVCVTGSFRFAVMVQEASDVVAVTWDDITVADEVMPGLLTEIGVIQTSQVTASVIDVWTALLSIQLDAPVVSGAPEKNTAGEREEGSS
jgi:chemotaxis signal transduction protein